VEAQLRHAVYEKAVPEENIAAGPAQVAFECLRQPFEDIQVLVVLNSCNGCC
jgi:hypothetical protein